MKGLQVRSVTPYHWRLWILVYWQTQGQAPLLSLLTSSSGISSCGSSSRGCSSSSSSRRSSSSM